MLALTESGLCLGVLDAQVWHRAELGKAKDRCKKPMEEKESYRWLEELREVNELRVHRIEANEMILVLQN
ncbi:hypothetical protein ACO1LB_13800 [Staphylococcus aureus]